MHCHYVPVMLSGMLRIIRAQLTHRAGRTVALLLGILVATTAFTVLSGTSQTAQLQVRGAVGKNFRTTYDILVRPKNSKTTLEDKQGLVQQNFLSGIFGGISLTQYHQIQRVPGVDVAAPVAMFGYTLPTVPIGIDLTGQLSPVSRQLFRVQTTWKSDRGISDASEPAGYVYVTRHPLAPSEKLGSPVTENLSNERSAPVCDYTGGGSGPFGSVTRENDWCWSTVNGNDGSGVGYPGLPKGHQGYVLYWAFPMLVAAIDPVAEARLDNLNGAVVSGRYLRGSDAYGAGSNDTNTFPVLASSRSYLDDAAAIQVQRLPSAVAEATVGSPTKRSQLAASTGPTVLRTQITAEQAYQMLLTQMAGRSNQNFFQGLDGYWNVGPTRYRTDNGGRLTPIKSVNPASVWASQFQISGFVRVPMDNSDTQFRAILEHTANFGAGGNAHLPAPRAVGVFDSQKLPSFNPLTKVPLSTYEQPQADPANAASRSALGGKSLKPTSNLGGYLAQPPQLITTLSALPALENSADYTGDTHAAAPISVIRVRVAGVHGADQVSRERVREVAQLVTQRTGLDVDITVGSSPTAEKIALPAGRHGRPDLLLTEQWVKKGVAVAILSAVDRKSLLLFVLILVVCGLFVANAASAAVRSRRTELGVLSCLGWRAPKLFTAMLGEVGVIGLAAGLLAAAAAWPLARLLGVEVTALRTVLAVPAALILALAAGLIPAWRAARADPGAAVRPAVQATRKSRTPRTVFGLAVTNLLRVPGRNLLGALSLAVGVGALTLLIAITVTFRGVLVGSLLGQAVAVQIRGVDYIAVVTMVVLGAASVVDVLYLNIRERSAELATLRATGWRDGPLTRLIAYEGFGLGLAGSLVGAGLGVAAAAVFAGTLTVSLLLTALGCGTIGVALATVAALVPATLLRRLPTAQLLAEE